MSIAVLTESVEGAWIVWLLSLVALCCLIRQAIVNMRWRSWGQFLRDEEGASYAIPFVLTLPFMLLIFCCVLQGTLVLLVKYGTVHAAYAAARAAIVWQGADPQSSREGRRLADFYADRAAVLAMAPFASGVEDHFGRAVFHFRPTVGGMDAFVKGPFLYVPMVNRYSQRGESSVTSPIIKDPDRTADTSYVLRKLRFAAFVTNAKIQQNANVVGFNRDLSVTVTYSMPLHIPMAAPIFDTHGFGSFFSRSRFYAKRVQTTVVLPSEAAQTGHGRLEVPYFPDDI